MPNLNKPVVNKVLAYVTNRGRLLVFRHTQFPEAGIQVPGGTMEAGEEPLEAALREAREESGLEDLQFMSFLGIQNFDCEPSGKDQIDRRYFFHFEAAGELPDQWLHLETDPSDHSASFYEFEFLWAQLPSGVPSLAGEQDRMLDELRLSSARRGSELG